MNQFYANRAGRHDDPRAFDHIRIPAHSTLTCNIPYIDSDGNAGSWNIVFHYQEELTAEDVCDMVWSILSLKMDDGYTIDPDLGLAAITDDGGYYNITLSK